MPFGPDLIVVVSKAVVSSMGRTAGAKNKPKLGRGIGVRETPRNMGKESQYVALGKDMGGLGKAPASAVWDSSCGVGKAPVAAVFGRSGVKENPVDGVGSTIGSANRYEILEMEAEADPNWNRELSDIIGSSIIVEEGSRQDVAVVEEGTRAVGRSMLSRTKKWKFSGLTLSQQELVVIADGMTRLFEQGSKGTTFDAGEGVTIGLPVKNMMASLNKFSFMAPDIFISKFPMKILASYRWEITIGGVKKGGAETRGRGGSCRANGIFFNGSGGVQCVPH